MNAPLGGAGAECVTPYVHKFVHHLPAIMHRFGAIRIFECDVMERDVALRRRLALRRGQFKHVEEHALVYEASAHEQHLALELP